MEDSQICPSARISKVLVAVLALFVGSIFYSLVGNFLELSLIEDILAGNPIDTAAIEASDSRQASTVLVTVGMWIVTAILFLVFLARAVRTAQEAGAENMSFTPGRAVGSFFIPFVNLVRPYRAVQEVWLATDPRADATSWWSAAPSLRIKVWWGMWIASGVIGNFVMRTYDGATTPEDYQSALHLQIISDGIDLALTVVFLLVIRALAERLQTKWELVHGPQTVQTATATVGEG